MFDLLVAFIATEIPRLYRHSFRIVHRLQAILLVRAPDRWKAFVYDLSHHE